MLVIITNFIDCVYSLIQGSDEHIFAEIFCNDTEWEIMSVLSQRPEKIECRTVGE